ncbi:hypothetical protein H4R34_002892 [Dimargaris verticillata]|uniref:NAD(P)-binding protein n=1 Tax=Dimargaris verticillata TaxID=2761393 RepID=A0A9W8ECH8_9FUNG|nr:hypothetical protein H4R34_002892 [Dimargaris verticillata]
MYKNLSGKTVFITGASSGIGEAVAKAYAAAGSNVILTARRADRLKALKARLEAQYPTVKVYATALDVTDNAQVGQVFDDLPAEFSRIDILINNAGLALNSAPVDVISLDSINTTLDTNVKGVVHCTRAVLPKMKTQAATNNLAIGGHIVNLSSAVAHHAIANGPIYCASKHAIDAITRSMRYDLANSKVKVSAVSPGYVQTEFLEVATGSPDIAKQMYGSMVPLQPEDVAETILFITSRPAHVDVADVLLYPHGQAGGQ